MKIKEVLHPEDAREFVQFPVRLYRNVPAWIRPLDADVEGVFDPEKNKTYRQGSCCRWLLVDQSGATIGRIAAFVVDKLVHKGNDQPTGGMGFFECIENQDAAFMLFDTCFDWLKAKGMEAMDGPVNFGNRDKWWGLLVDGFDREPNYQCNYNFPYYQKFFEAYGFKPYFYQLTYIRKIADPLDPRLAEKAALVARNPDYSFRHMTSSEMPKLAEYLRLVYNRAWANRAENPELSQAQAALIVKQMKPILDKKLLWFGFYKEEPVAFFLSLPEVNQIFKHVNGKLDTWGKIKFLWYRFRGVEKAFGILFGVVPEHQGKGVDGALITAARQLMRPGGLHYTEYEMNWIGDFNPKMIQVVEQVGGFVGKTHITYRKLFNPDKEFKRHPILR